MRSRRVRVVGVALAAVAASAVIAPSVAWGRFSGAANASMSVKSATLAPATDVHATCKLGSGFSFSAAISWTASATSEVSSYYVEADGGGTKVGADISNRTTATASNLQYGVTYTISVTAEAGNWTATPATTTVKCTLFGN